MKPKLIYISTRCPWPRTSGRDLMIEQSLRALSKLYDVTFVLLGDKLREKQVISLVSNLIELPAPNLFEVMLNRLIRPRQSFQESLFYSRRSHRHIKNLLRDPSVEAVACDMVRTASYLPNDKRFLTICDMDDLLSRRYQQMSKLKTSQYSIFGTHASKPLFRFCSIIARPFMQAVLTLEQTLMKSREIEIANAVDLVMVVSPIEARELSNRTKGRARILAFPPSIETFLIDQDKLLQANISVKQLNLLFVGDMRTPANSLAAHHILSEVLPLLSKDGVEYRMRFVGSASGPLSRDISADENCVHLGWVEDLANLYKWADLVLCPFITGTGIKIKVLEAMAYSKVVITNALGIEGLDVKVGKELIVGDFDKELISAIKTLREDHALRSRIGAAAREYIQREHAPEKLADILLNQLARIRTEKHAKQAVTLNGSFQKEAL